MNATTTAPPAIAPRAQPPVGPASLTVFAPDRRRRVTLRALRVAIRLGYHTPRSMRVLRRRGLARLWDWAGRPVFLSVTSGTAPRRTCTCGHQEAGQSARPGCLCVCQAAFGCALAILDRWCSSASMRRQTRDAIFGFEASYCCLVGFALVDLAVVVTTAGAVVHADLGDSDEMQSRVQFPVTAA